MDNPSIRGRENFSPVNSSWNAEPGYSKISWNEDLINSISAVINTKLTEFSSEMITIIYKNGDQPVSLGDMNSYYEDFEINNLPKREKGKSGDTHSDDLSALFKNGTNNNNNNNNNNGPAVGQKRPITNNNKGNNTPAKVSCCKNQDKTVSDVEVDSEILNYDSPVDQEHQIPQDLCENILE